MMPTFFPMLAQAAAAPFDSAEHFFDVKWDGVRCLAAVDRQQWRLWGRAGADYTARYPELEEALRCLPAGTRVDGELVVLRQGLPQFKALLSRHQLTQAFRIRQAAVQTPVQYILFDVLADRDRPLLDEPFWRRRQILSELLAAQPHPSLGLCEGEAVHGQAFFERVVAQGHEGVMAKLQTSRYLPGRRSAGWQKIKPRALLPCVIIGYTTSGSNLDSLLVASAEPGQPLRYVAQLHAGLGVSQKRALARQLAPRQRAAPVVPCPRQAHWVEPELYCRVRFWRRTADGRWCGATATFAGLIETGV